MQYKRHHWRTKLALEKTTRVATHKGAKVIVEKQSVLKARVVCKEDTRKTTTTISIYILSSHNASNTQPLFLVCDSMWTPSNPKSTSVESKGGVSGNHLMSIDMEFLESTRESEIHVSQNGSTNGGLGEGNVSSHIEGGDLIHISNGDEDVEMDDDFQKVPPPPKRAKRNYESTRKFQGEWASKLVRVEAICGANGQAHLLNCTVCLTFEKKPKFLGPTWGTLTNMKGGGRRHLTCPNLV